MAKLIIYIPPPSAHPDTTPVNTENVSADTPKSARKSATTAAAHSGTGGGVKGPGRVAALVQSIESGGGTPKRARTE
jgi:hypothetical protein